MHSRQLFHGTAMNYYREPEGGENAIVISIPIPKADDPVVNSEPDPEYLSSAEIMDFIRIKTGMSIRKWAAQHGIAHGVVQPSSGGKGSRNCRVAIARLIGLEPSQVWPNLSDKMGGLDDALYFMVTAIKRDHRKKIR